MMQWAGIRGGIDFDDEFSSDNWGRSVSAYRLVQAICHCGWARIGDLKEFITASGDEFLMRFDPNYPG